VINSRREESAYSREALLLIRRGGKSLSGRTPSIPEVVNKFKGSLARVSGVGVEQCEHRSVRGEHIGVIYFRFSNDEHIVLTVAEFQAILRDANHISRGQYSTYDLLPSQKPSIPHTTAAHATA